MLIRMESIFSNTFMMKKALFPLVVQFFALSKSHNPKLLAGDDFLAAHFSRIFSQPAQLV